MRIRSVTAALTLCPAVAAAAPFVVPLDDAQSSLTLQLCIQGQCTSDTASASGFVTIDVDAVGQITTVTLHDFNIAMSRPAILNLNFGFLGRFDSTVSDFTTSNPNPALSQAASQVAGSQFSFLPVVSLQTGLVNYNATGAVCSNLTGQGLPCIGAIDLATRPPTTNVGGGQCAGAPMILDVTSVGRVVTISGNICGEVLLNPLSPSTGALLITGSLFGSVTVPLPPCRADLNGDRLVNTSDLTAFLGAFGQTVTPGSPGDLNSDGAVNTADLTAFLGAFGTACADH